MLAGLGTNVRFPSHRTLKSLSRFDSAEGRGYDSFWTQGIVGTAEFSDMPMQRPPEEDLYFEFFKAKHTTKYLEDYVDQHRYSGLTLRKRIRFSTEVQSVLKTDGLWSIRTKDRDTGVEQNFSTLLVGLPQFDICQYYQVERFFTVKFSITKISDLLMS